jgi:hypothetical protein
MSDWKMLDRDGRAMLLAATVKITQNDNGWRVPSQSGRGHAPYTVNLDGDAPLHLPRPRIAWLCLQAHPRGSDCETEEAV